MLYKIWFQSFFDPNFRSIASSTAFNFNNNSSRRCNLLPLLLLDDDELNASSNNIGDLSEYASSSECALLLEPLLNLADERELFVSN